MDNLTVNLNFVHLYWTNCRRREICPVALRHWPETGILSSRQKKSLCDSAGGFRRKPHEEQVTLPVWVLNLQFVGAAPVLTAGYMLGQIVHWNREEWGTWGGMPGSAEGPVRNTCRPVWRDLGPAARCDPGSAMMGWLSLLQVLTSLPGSRELHSSLPRAVYIERMTDISHYIRLFVKIKKCGFYFKAVDRGYI